MSTVRMNMSQLGERLLTTDKKYADSAWTCPIQDAPTDAAFLRTGAGLVLQQEGLIRDMISVGNRQVRRNLGFSVGDRIVLKLLVSPELWWAVHFNLDLLAAELLVEDIEINQVDVPTAVAAGWEEIEVGDKKTAVFTAYMTAVQTDTQRFSKMRVETGIFSV